MTDPCHGASAGTIFEQLTGRERLYQLLRRLTKPSPLLYIQGVFREGGMCN